MAEYGFDESVMTIDAPLLQDHNRQVHVVPSLDCLADLREPVRQPHVLHRVVRRVGLCVEPWSRVGRLQLELGPHTRNGATSISTKTRGAPGGPHR